MNREESFPEFSCPNSCCTSPSPKWSSDLSNKREPLITQPLLLSSSCLYAVEGSIFYDLGAKSSPLPIFVNRVLLKYNHTLYLCIVYGCFCSTLAEWVNIIKASAWQSLKYFLVLYRKQFAALCYVAVSELDGEASRMGSQRTHPRQNRRVKGLLNTL